MKVTSVVERLPAVPSDAKPLNDKKEREFSGRHLPDERVP